MTVVPVTGRKSVPDFMSLFFVRKTEKLSGTAREPRLSNHTDREGNAGPLIAGRVFMYESDRHDLAEEFVFRWSDSATASERRRKTNSGAGFHPGLWLSRHDRFVEEKRRDGYGKGVDLRYDFA
jgi:hypothetical protein